MFAGHPPFPDDVPTAPLLRLSLRDLLAQDKTETQRLSEACEQIGFFYLDLRDAGAVSHILEDADKLFEIQAGMFDLPLEEKQKYDFSSRKSYFGYKAQGVGAIDRQGTLDRNEFYNISKDDIMGISEPLPAPGIINDSRCIFKSFMENSHSIVTLILNLLNKSLGLPESTFANLHRLSAVSGDQVRFVKAPPQPVDDRRTALGEHTDFGSVTILFNRLGGLQVLPPGADAEWQYVKPLPGHAIVNLGDAMVKFTNGLFRSNIHRVVSPPGAQADSTRYSLVYFARPEDDVALRRLEGSSRIPELQDGVEEEKINSKDWIIRRALGRRVDVPDIEYDKSVGTEMLSRRLKPTSPAEFFHFSPSREASPLHSIGARKSQENNPSDIEQKRKSFFASCKDTLLSLLGDVQYLGPFAAVESAESIQIQPYIQLPSQPVRLRAMLKPYQLDGLSWLLHLRRNGVGGILADDMGLGKTLQTLSLFQHILDKEIGEHRFLVNDLTELWSILRWLYPEVFGADSIESFQDAFSLEEGKFDSRFVSHVNRFLELIMLRRLKTSAGINIDIPEKKETVLSVPLTEMQLGWYRKILTGDDQSGLPVSDSREAEAETNLSPIEGSDNAMNEWETHGVVDVEKSRITTNTLMELRKCSIHPYLLADAIPEQYSIGPHIVESSGKFILLRKMVRHFVVENKQKIIIFSGFEQALNLCEDLLEMESEHSPFRHVRLDGSTTSAWRNLSVFLFQNVPDYMVFLVSIRAGGEGLNLVSSSTVIFLDDDWNPQVMRQAESRVHRIGQTKPVQVFRIHSKGTVEEQIRRRLAKKAYLADQVVGDLGNGIPHAMELDDAEDQDISLMPSKDIVSDTLDAAKLEDSDFASILNSCTVDVLNVQEMSHTEQKAWLECNERVKTDIFNGERIITSPRRFSVYDETLLGVSKASRRIGKSRVVMVGEWEVSKESMLQATNPTTSFPKAVEEKASKVHDDCLEKEDHAFSKKGSTIYCPHHYCCECGKTANDAGRLLLSCLKCPRAFCEGCLNWDGTKFVDANADAESRGYSPRNAFYIECINCRETAAKRLSDVNMFLDSAKRANRH
ncbi:hypothetical protein BDV18DRAFT_166971 [Aspergillus unguis]